MMYLVKFFLHLLNFFAIFKKKIEKGESIHGLKIEKGESLHGLVLQIGISISIRNLYLN